MAKSTFEFVPECWRIRASILGKYFRSRPSLTYPSNLPLVVQHERHCPPRRMHRPDGGDTDAPSVSRHAGADALLPQAACLDLPGDHRGDPPRRRGPRQPSIFVSFSERI